MPEDTLYQAFILYPDSAPEKKIAAKLENEIHKFKIPSKVKSTLTSKDLQKTFLFGAPLETSDAGSDEKTNEALRYSRFLIVICSPRAVATPMVTAIIQKFMEFGKGEQILTLLVSGTPAESFPQVLFDGDQLSEPLAANICALDEKSSLKRLKDFEKYRLFAPILGCEFYDLKQTHLVWERQTSLVKILTVSLLLFSAGIFYLSQALTIHAESKRFKSYQRLNTDIIAEVCQTIPERLKDVPGAELMLQEVLWSRADIEQLINERIKTVSDRGQRDKYNPTGTRISENGLKQIQRGFSKFKEKDFDRLSLAFDKISPAEGIDDFFIRLFLASQRNKLRYRDEFKVAAEMNGIKTADDLHVRLFLANLKNKLSFGEELNILRGIEDSASSEKRWRNALTEFLENIGKWFRKADFEPILKDLEKIR